MEVEITEDLRQAEDLQSVVDRYRELLAHHPSNIDAIYLHVSQTLTAKLDNDFSKVLSYIQVKLDWPLAYKCLLLRRLQKYAHERNEKFHQHAGSWFDPKLISNQTRRFTALIPTVASIERQYGSGVAVIFSVYIGFFLINLLTLLLWLAFIIIPCRALDSSTQSINGSLQICTLKNSFSESVLFQGAYPNSIIGGKYNLSLIYLLTTYIYYIIWFIFITVRFASAYRRKVFDSILNTKLGVGFTCTFARYNFTVKTRKDKDKCIGNLQRQYRDLMRDGGRNKMNQQKRYQSFRYKLKKSLINILYIVLAIVLGVTNWFVVSSCANKTVGCAQSVIYLILINRSVPYLVAILTQKEEYTHLSNRLNAVGFRCVLLNLAMILPFTIVFFTYKPLCYETKFGEYMYVILLADIIASLFFPIVFGLILDFTYGKKDYNFDGINLHTQLSPPVLLYSQCIMWLGIYFAPLLSVLMLINIICSFLSHRLYFFIRSKNSESYKRVFIWNAHRLEYFVYLLAYIMLIVSLTYFIVFTTQIKPSKDCGPFRQLNASYEVIDKFLRDDVGSPFLSSVMNFLTAPGFIYFLGVTFFVLVYKLHNEELAEKQLVFIRESNLETRKALRLHAVRNAR